MNAQKVRIDKWLWSVRIFKSRSIAAEAVKSGKVRIDGTPVKPAHHLSKEDVVEVRKNGFNFKFRVLELIEKRVGAPIARTCYQDMTPAEELNKYNDWFIGKAGVEKREKGTGRPTKRERREIDLYKTDLYLDWDDWE